MGISTKSQIIFDIYGITKNNIVFGTDFSFGGLNDLDGKKYNNISWNKFPEDIVDEGYYNNSYNFLLGIKINKSFNTYLQKLIFIGKIGYIDNIEYQNRHDSFGILGNSDGNYYIIRRVNGNINFGAEIRCFLDEHFNIGIGYDIGEKFLFKIGFIF